MINRHLIVVIPDLPEKHKNRIREAAERFEFTCRFFDEPAQSLPYLRDAEIIVGTDPVLSRNAPNLRVADKLFRRLRGDHLRTHHNGAA